MARDKICEDCPYKNTCYYDSEKKDVSKYCKEADRKNKAKNKNTIKV
jgi:hypothetical protein